MNEQKTISKRMERLIKKTRCARWFECNIRSHYPLGIYHLVSLSILMASRGCHSLSFRFLATAIREYRPWEVTGDLRVMTCKQIETRLLMGIHWVQSWVDFDLVQRLAESSYRFSEVTGAAVPAPACLGDIRTNFLSDNFPLLSDAEWALANHLATQGNDPVDIFRTKQTRSRKGTALLRTASALNKLKDYAPNQKPQG